MKMRVRKAVFPAAGLGTRFLPATKAQPKEMLPLVDKPIIQYGVEEALAAGCDQIIIVTGRGKTAIEDHFDVSYELEKMLEERGKMDLLAIVRDLEKEMRRLSRELAFEDAAKVRDRIIAMRKRLSGEDAGEDDAEVALAAAATPPRRPGPVRNYRRSRRGP